MGEEEPFEIPIEDILDLHAFQPSDVVAVAEEYLIQARRKFESVRLIHGKGIGLQRERIRSMLATLDFVARFADAPEEAGGRGATIVWFRS